MVHNLLLNSRVSKGIQMAGSSFKFADKKDKKNQKEKWRVLIVDDDEQVHTITQAVLRTFMFEDKNIEFISAYSAKEAKEKLLSLDDIALILLDVVMEENTSGLNIAKFIREDMKNSMTRIVLRTGQPGSAPEEKVIIDYDINDYKEKTELTAKRLFTTVISSLRNYRDLKIIDDDRRILNKNREGLRQVIDSSAHLFEIRSLKDFANGVLTQIIAMVGIDNNSIYVQKDSLSVEIDNNRFNVLAGTGIFKELSKAQNPATIPKSIEILFNQAIEKKERIFVDDIFIGYFKTKSGHTNLLYVKGCQELNETDSHLIDIFLSNVAIAFENLYLDKEIQDTQKEVITTLGEVVENRSHEAGNHVKRVGFFTYLLAKRLGLEEEEAMRLKTAAPMHDVGKIAISDSILMKEGKLTDDEFSIMKKHAYIGYEILNKSPRELMKCAALVARDHHEKFDGSGYPNEVSGEDISLYGRIVAVADVFDALSHKRCYKEAWLTEDVLNYFKEQSGKHFDPKIVKILFDNIDEFLDINERYSDNVLEVNADIA